VGFAIGVHPAIALGALAIGSIDEDERAIMGALLREPLELVKCETSDVLVPAHAEMIIEAEIQPGARTPEGPFGEFTGYSLGEREREVVKVKAITHRTGAYFQDITVAHLDHMLLSTIPMEANLYRAVRAMVPSVKAVRVPGPFTCYVSLEQRLPGQAKNAILSVLGADMYMKRVVVVDHDVDIFDDRQVTWAIATRCQPDRDITIVTHARGSDLDPSTAQDGYSAKWGVDATAKPSLAGFTPRHRVPPETWQRVNLKDYGLGRPRPQGSPKDVTGISRPVSMPWPSGGPRPRPSSGKTARSPGEPSSGEREAWRDRSRAAESPRETRSR
jgi:2,5-furandicarboxylate decarboxylase 1